MLSSGASQAWRAPDPAASEALHPDALPFARGEIVASSLPGGGQPVVRHAHPLFVGKECRLIDQDAADPEVLFRVGLHVEAIAKPHQPLAERRKARSTVGPPVNLPRHRHRQLRIVGEESKPADGVERHLQLEEQRLARLQRLERLRPRPPEVDLLHRRLDHPEKGEPLVVGIRDEAAHEALLCARPERIPAAQGDLGDECVAILRRRST